LKENILFYVFEKRRSGSFNTVAFLPLKTPFCLVIRFITILQVVTSITFYTVTHLQNLQSLHANLCSLSLTVFITHFTSSQADLLHSSVDLVPLFIFPEGLAVIWRLPTANCLRCSSCLQDNTFARTPRKTVAPLFRCVRTIS
jgi:hypothetical protein